MYKLNAQNYKRGTILVANHQSRLDFFLIHTGIPFHRYVQMLPIYQLTADIYMNTWWKRLFLTLGGCIPIDSTSKLRSTVGLLNLLDKIEKGNSVLIFPQGKVVKARETNFFSGIGYLLHKKTNPVIPIYLEGFTNINPLSFLLRRHRATIIYGQQIHVKKSHYKKIAQTIMKSIYSYGV